MIKKLIASQLLLLAFSSKALAQDSNNFSERNLVDNTPAQKSQIVKTESQPKENPIASLNGIANNLEKIFLNKNVTSLMFDDEQNSNIERAVDAFKNIGSGDLEKSQGLDGIVDGQGEGQYQINEKSRVYLGSILYLTPRDWVVWVNNQKITSFTNNRKNEIYLRQVNKDSAKILWTLSVSKWKILSGKNSEESAPKINDKGQIEIEFDLKPNQTFLLTNGTTIEGRISIQKAKPKSDVVKDSATPNENAAPGDIVAPPAVTQTAN